MYRIATRWAMSEATEVPLDANRVHDLGQMGEAIDEGTTVVYLCNPNNPTGTIVSSAAMGHFIGSVPDSVLVVIDEAYHDYVTDPSYASSISHALERPNVVVLRTFSKVFALAGHRIGYAVAHPRTIEELRKAQPPFTVSDVAQVAAVASLGNPEELRRRVDANAAGRHHLQGALSERSLPHTESQANFVFLELEVPADDAANLFTSMGVIVRPMSGGWLRVTVGSPSDNRRFIEALDEVLAMTEAASG
jgi:histidinol-phosphate aminotransferase